MNQVFWSVHYFYSEHRNKGSYDVDISQDLVQRPFSLPQLLPSPSLDDIPFSHVNDHKGPVLD